MRRLEDRKRAFAAMDSAIRLFRACDTPPPEIWPGGNDPSLERPDLIKQDLDIFLSRTEPWKSKLRSLEARFRKGPLDYLPDLDDWAIEEFFWHGLPEENNFPVDAFLLHDERRFPPSAREQLRGWKEARVEAYEIGEVDGETVALAPWDLIGGCRSGKPIRAIALNLGGVNAYRKLCGSITITYVAPWVPEDNLYCAMGYAVTSPRDHAVELIPYIGLKQPVAAARAYPWKEDAWKEREHHSLWKLRDWQRWFSERLQFPFQALIPLTSPGEHAVMTITGLLDASPERARTFGIYLECSRGDANYLAGATAVMPVDFTIPSSAALAEYRDYRSIVGPPPGVLDGDGYTGAQK